MSLNSGFACGVEQIERALRKNPSEGTISLCGPPSRAAAIPAEASVETADRAKVVCATPDGQPIASLSRGVKMHVVGDINGGSAVRVHVRWPDDEKYYLAIYG